RNENTAAAGASTLLRNPKVFRAILKDRAAKVQRVEITQDWVISRLVQNAEACLKPDENGRPYNPAAANKALELLGKHLGLFPDRTELEIRGKLEHDHRHQVAAVLRTEAGRELITRFREQYVALTREATNGDTEPSRQLIHRVSGEGGEPSPLGDAREQQPLEAGPAPGAAGQPGPGTGGEEDPPADRDLPTQARQE